MHEVSMPTSIFKNETHSFAVRYLTVTKLYTAVLTHTDAWKRVRENVHQSIPTIHLTETHAILNECLHTRAHTYTYTNTTTNTHKIHATIISNKRKKKKKRRLKQTSTEHF